MALVGLVAMPAALAVLAALAIFTVLTVASDRGLSVAAGRSVGCVVVGFIARLGWPERPRPARANQTMQQHVRSRQVTASMPL